MNHESLRPDPRQELRERRNYNLYVLGGAESVVSAAAESAPDNETACRITLQQLAAHAHCRSCLERARGAEQDCDAVHPDRIIGIRFVERMLAKGLASHQFIGTDESEILRFSRSDKEMAQNIVRECRDDKNYARLPDLLTLLRYQIEPEDIGETDDSIRKLEFMAMTVRAKELLAAYRAVPEGTEQDHSRNVAWLIFYQYALAMQGKSPGYAEDFYTVLGMNAAEGQKFLGKK